MYHTLKTLHAWCSKHNRELVVRFRDLAEYCQDADELHHRNDLNRGYKSLKWLIYSLREKLTQAELEQVFYYCLIEAAIYGEKYLYDDVFHFAVARQNRHLLARPEFNPDDYPQLAYGPWTILVNESGANITNLVFRRKIAQIIVFRNPAENWAGIIFDERGSEILKDFDVPAILQALQARGEPWLQIGNNLILCGGPKAPENRTKIDTPDLLAILKEGKRDG